MSQKTIVMIMMSVGMTIGGLVPWLFGDHDVSSGWPILGGLVGGIIGIWAGAKLAKKLR
jgi:uncharacterized membrane protein YfcA